MGHDDLAWRFAAQNSGKVINKMTANHDMADKWMGEALALAEMAWGMTSPNPMVGAVVVRDGQVVGRGYHHRAGEPHAEVNALRDAGDAARGADIYVTLEPCSTGGRTPPCTGAIIKAGLRRVFVGASDPNPAHRGAGMKILSDAGIEVFDGILQKPCEKLNEAFFKWIATGTPFVLLKMAMTLDGKIATAGGSSQWITGTDARLRVQRLRQWADAVMVGGGTARTDRPGLMVREPENWARQPRRLVASTGMSTAEAAALLQPGVAPEVIRAAAPVEWRQVLRRLGAEQVTAILVEGGGELADSLLKAGVVDKVEFHIAPKILGGRGSRPVVGGDNPASLAESVPLTDVETFPLGNDIGVSGYPVICGK